MKARVDSVKIKKKSLWILKSTKALRKTFKVFFSLLKFLFFLNLIIGRFICHANKEFSHFPETTPNHSNYTQ